MTPKTLLARDPSLLSERELIFELTIPGEPATKARPRYGKGRTYTPAATRSAQEAVGWLAQAALHGREPNDVDGLGVEIVFETSTYQRRDIDNLAKLVLDGLNGIVWRDDDQIVELHLAKHRGGAEPKTVVQVWIAEPRARNCQQCDKALTLAQVTSGAPFCSKACYDLAQRRGHYRVCVGCGTTVYRQLGKAHSEKVYCTPECRRRTWGSCRQCSGELPTKKHRFCSPECRKAYFHARQVGGRHHKGRCSDCGRPTYRVETKRCRGCHLAQLSRKEAA